VELLENATKCLSQDSWCFGLASNQVPQNSGLECYRYANLFVGKNVCNLSSLLRIGMYASHVCKQVADSYFSYIPIVMLSESRENDALN
jgi:hypothetical protein